MSNPDVDVRPDDFAPVIRRRETDPRPAYVVVTIDAPSRLRRDQTRLVHTVRVEDYDPEHQTPLSYALAAVEDPEIRGRLIELRDGHEDWYVTIWSDDRVVYHGHPFHAITEIEHAADDELKAVTRG